jgi:hypothetical protein
MRVVAIVVLLVFLVSCARHNTDVVGVWQSSNHFNIVSFARDGSGTVLAEDGKKRDSAITYTVHDGNTLTIAPYGQTWVLKSDGTLAGAYTDGSAGDVIYHRMTIPVAFCGQTLCYSSANGYY